VYALFRKGKLVEPGAADEAAKRVRDGIVPILGGRPGFRLHLGFVSETFETVRVTFYDDREAALDAYERVRVWVAENTRDLTMGEPEVRSGTVLLHREAAQRHHSPDAALFVTIRQYEGVGPTEEALPLLAEHTLPIIEGHAGFRGFYAFRDERNPHHAVSVSLWRDRAVALSAHERVLLAMEALRSVFPMRPTVTAGAARIIAAP
jgi:quinol monooxygenase YgiN